MSISSYEELAGYILRRLGAPVLNIEVEDNQLRDRIDDAFQYFVERHYEGSSERIVRIDFTEADEATQTIPLPKNCIHIGQIYNLTNTEASSSEEFERLNYLISQSEFFTISQSGGVSHDLKNYHVTMEYLSLLKRYFNRPIHHQIDRVEKLIRVPSHTILADNYIILRGLFARDPADSPDLFNERWIKEYATQLVKRQWGENLKKYEGVEMAGGVTVQGQKIWEEAQIEIDKLEEKFADKYQLPYGIFWG